MAGEYRLPEVLAKLPENLAAPMKSGQLRITLTNQPMTGVDRHPELNEEYAKAYEGIPGAAKYAVGLRNGSMLVIAPHGINMYGKITPEKVYSSGELFMTS